MFYFCICCLVLNATSQQAKKIGLFGYPSIISLAMIIIGGCIAAGDVEPSTIIVLLYVCVGLFILFLLIFAIMFLLNRFRKLKMPKLYLRTPNGALESKNGSQNTPLISDV